jgi:toxin YoeB
MNIIFSEYAWSEYLQWQQEDGKTVKKINDMIKDIERNGYEGIGKPEPLKHKLSGYWSRRITEKDRLIYRRDEENIFIIGCKGHYND